MTTAFDFGSHRLRSMCQAGSRLISRQCRTIYQVVPNTDTWRDLLSGMKIGFAVSQNTLTVIGDDAERIRDICSVPVAGLLPDGCLAEDDPASRQILSHLVEGVLPAAIRPGEVCCLILPGSSYLNRTSENSELDLCVHLIEMRGYDVRILSSSMGVVLAAGEATEFTGVGMNFGESTCEVSLSRKGVEIAHCSIPTGGDWINETLAKAESRFVYDREGTCYLDKSSVRQWREQTAGSIAEPASDGERLLRECYDQMINRVMTESAAELLAAADKYRMTEPLAVYCAGGVSQATGFNRLLARYLQTDHNFPIPVGSVRVLDDDGFASVKGCLINAEIETEMLLRNVAAA